MGNDSRRREDASIRLEQRFEDFLATYANNEIKAQKHREEHDQSHNELLAELEERFKPLEKLYETINTPAKVVGTLIMLFLTPVLGFLGWNLAKYVIVHMAQIFKAIPQNGG